MTMENWVDEHGTSARTRITGVLTSKELIEFQFWLISEHKKGKLKANYNHLIDARNVTVIQVGEEDIRRLSQINNVYGRDRDQRRIGIVVDSSQSKMLANLHKTLSKQSGVEVEVFDTRIEACNWLDIDPMLDLFEGRRGDKKQVRK